MSNPDRRNLLKVVGAGALGSSIGWAAESETRPARVPRVLVNSFAMRLQKSSGGATIFAVDFSGYLDKADHLHCITGHLEFHCLPGGPALARAVKKMIVEKAAADFSVKLRPQDVAVVIPRLS